MTTQVDIGGTLLIMTDVGLQDVEWIEYDGRVWLAPLWIAQPGQKTQRPLRIVAPKFAPGFEMRLEPKQVAEFFQKIPLPDSLLERGAIPDGLRPLVEIRENPDIVASYQSASPDLQ